MDIYTVTFCTQDQDVGANFFWHTCILLSRFDPVTKKMEVVDTWGFYGSPSSNVGTLLHSLKMLLAVDTDIYGNHGKLRHEDIRYLDTGRGLHGVTFELTKEKFDELETRCINMCEDEFRAIQELAAPLKLVGKPKQQTRNYPQENQSRQFFELEAAAAAEQHRPPRLKEFQLSLFPGSNTCKAQAIKLLDGIITPEQLARVTGLHGSVSRFSGRMENIYLHSTGPLRSHKKKNGEVVYSRSNEDKDVKLFWSLPPQEVETLHLETEEYFYVDPHYRDEIKKLISQLQQFEWYFINAEFDKMLKPYCDSMLTMIRAYYESFAMLTPKPIKRAKKSCSDVIERWIFHPPIDADEKHLQNHIAEIKSFMERMSLALTTDFTTEQMTEGSLRNNLEMLAYFFPEQKKREMCNIIGVNFDAREEEYSLVL